MSKIEALTSHIKNTVQNVSEFVKNESPTPVTGDQLVNLGTIGQLVQEGRPPIRIGETQQGSVLYEISPSTRDIQDGQAVSHHIVLDHARDALVSEAIMLEEAKAQEIQKVEGF